MKVIQFPLAKITFCFILGILVGNYFKWNLYWFWIAFTLISFTLTLFFYFKKNKKIFGLTALLTAFFTGVITLLSHQEINHPNHYIHQIQPFQKEISAQIVLNEKLKTTAFSHRYIAQIHILNGRKAFGKVLVNFSKDSIFQDFETGSVLYIKGSFYKNRITTNPNQFDYGKYLANKQIYGQIYTDYSSSQIIDVNKTIGYYASKLRNTIAINLNKNGFSKKELSIVMALILGQQQDISPDVIRDYQFAGAVHILSVSGLHIGCLLLVLNFFLGFLPNTKNWRIYKLLFIIGFLWAFAVLAGLAPAVLRSVTMYSFVTVGLYLRKSVNIYHTLLVSMLLILIVEPSFLFDVGFQLSYLALFFIVWLQPLLNRLYNPTNKISHYIWEIITVSFAAQIGTLPLSLYYFHQFPSLFFITNLVILPALGIIMGYGVFVMILALFNASTYWIIKPLEWSIWLMNKVIHWIASLENFVLKDISFTASMMWFMYAVIILFFITIEKPTFRKIVLVLCSIIGLQLLFFFQKYDTQKTNELIVFNKNRNTAISIRNSDKITLYANDSIIKNHKTDWDFQAYSIGNFCTIEEAKPLENFYYFKDKKIMVIDSSGVYLEDVQPNIVLLSNSPKINLDRFLQSTKPQIIIADGSNFKTYRKLWKESCQKHKILFHDTTEKGFYSIKF